MSHFGLICPESTGHLNTMLPLGQELQRRGHRVTLFGIHDAEAKVLSAGLEYKAIGEQEFPSGVLAQSLAHQGKLSGMAAFRSVITLIRDLEVVRLRDMPQAIRDAHVTALLVDQASPGGGAIADFLEIPFISICSAVVLNQEDAIPPHFTNWRYNPAWWARVRNRMAYRLLNRLVEPIRAVVREQRRQWKLAPHAYPDDRYSQLAQISQQPAELEFPRQQLPPWFHFTGPYHSSAGRDSVFFPYEKLTGQPLIYASMGTIQNRLIGVFRTIAEACLGLDAQLVIALGGGHDPESLPPLPGSPIVVGFAPQLDLLRRAALTITHAGMNTTLECLANGVPMVAIPIANDQPGVAARIAWTGAGDVVLLRRLSVPRLRLAIKRVLSEDSYKRNTLRLQQAIQAAGGVRRAADIVEQVITTGGPVLA